MFRPRVPRSGTQCLAPAVRQADYCGRNHVCREHQVLRTLVQSPCRAAVGCIEPEGVEGA
jgi:hypothetical protein